LTTEEPGLGGLEFAELVVRECSHFFPYPDAGEVQLSSSAVGCGLNAGWDRGFQGYPLSGKDPAMEDFPIPARWPDYLGSVQAAATGVLGRNPCKDSSKLLGQVPSRSLRTVGRRIAGEYILVPIVSRGADADIISKLNGLAAFFWKRLDGGTTGEFTVQAMVERYEVDRGAAIKNSLDLFQKFQVLQAGVKKPDSPRTGHGGDSAN